MNIVGFKGVKHDVIGTPWRPTPPSLPLSPFSARLARSESSTGLDRQTDRQDGQALQWASEEMKGDRELCMAAVAQHGLLLKDLPEEMKGDREMCMAAVAQDGKALQWPGRR